MKSHFFFRFLLSIGIYLCLSGDVNAIYGPDINQDGKADIVWNNKGTGKVSVWLMNNTTYSSVLEVHNAAGPVVNTDKNWKIVGIGDFDLDGNRDIVWQNQGDGQSAVWYLEGADHVTLNRTAVLPSAGVDWKIMGVGDFDGNGTCDIFLQNDLTGQKATWLMNGVTLTFGAITADTAGGWGTTWQARGTGDFNVDGLDDVFLQNTATGQLAIFTMTATTANPRTTLTVVQPDADWYVVGCANYTAHPVVNFSGNRQSAQADLLWRYVPNGRNAVWAMNGAVVSSTMFIKPECDLAFKCMTQSWTDSIWRQNDPFYQTLTVTPSGPNQVLTFRFPTGFNAQIRRRELGQSWPGPAGTSTVSTWTDYSALVSGKTYEYEVKNLNSPGQVLFASTGASLPHDRFDNRGKLLLLVDRDLVTLNHAGLNAALDLYVQDLIADGWIIERYKTQGTNLDATRHDDGTTAASSTPTDEVTSVAADTANTTNRDALKTWINAPARGNPVGIVLIGHVTMPFSGNYNRGLFVDDEVDGHINHKGSWIADTFYGDSAATSTWGNTAVGYNTCAYGPNDEAICTPPWNRNAAGDYRLDQMALASTQSRFVGRIDFARLPTLGTGNTANSVEAALMANYLQKIHNYRVGITRLLPRSMVYTTYNVGIANDFKINVIGQIIYNNATRNTSNLFGTANGKLTIGWPFHQRSDSYMFGFSGANGVSFGISAFLPFFAEPEGWLFRRLTSDFANSSIAPSQIGCHILIGSYFGDYNFSDDVLRALLATPLYNYAALYTRWTEWQLHHLNYGGCLGDALLETVKRPFVSGAAALPGSSYGADRVYSYSAIVGDPTLRINIVGTPTVTRQSSASGTVTLNIVPASGETGCQYYVYRCVGSIPNASTSSLPFQLLEGPISGPQSSSTIAVNTHYTYLIKAEKNVSTGTGTYKVKSQGTYYHVYDSQ